MGQKNLMAVGIYVTAIPLSWLLVPLALLLIATPVYVFIANPHQERLREEG